jgi:hypothetical protein
VELRSLRQYSPRVSRCAAKKRKASGERVNSRSVSARQTEMKRGSVRIRAIRAALLRNRMSTVPRIESQARTRIYRISVNCLQSIAAITGRTRAHIERQVGDDATTNA